MASKFVWNWLFPGNLAIGSHPQTEQDWNVLRRVGITAVFNCCFPEEDRHLPTVPVDWEWKTVRSSLPDHRRQIPLSEEIIKHSLEAICELYAKSECLYVHCWAGQERSVLMSIGLMALQYDMTIFEALDYIKREHPQAKPIFDQLAILDEVLNSPFAREEIG